VSYTIALELIGGLGLFLYGMNIMSEGLQRVAGQKLRKFLRTLTSNRIAGVFTGLTVTSVVQSSSATTVMLVGFVNAGLLNLTQAIGVIMGANIGTTITGWLIALIGFKVEIALLALPAIGFGFFIRFLGRQKLTDWGSVLVGFGLLFLGFTFMKDAVLELRNSPDVSGWLSGLHVTDLGSFWIAILCGTIVTMLIQSSSATMALTMTLAQQGLIDFPTAAALLLGENIGTTITANLAAIGATAAAKQTACAHMIFNVIGVMAMMFYFRWILRFIDMVVPGNALSTDVMAAASIVPDHMAAFHTTFNVMNMLIMLPFIGLIAKLARTIVRGKPIPKKERTHALRFISFDLVATPALAIEGARQTLNYMGMRSLEGIDALVELLMKDNGDQDYDSKSEDVIRIEQEMDDYEEDLTLFLMKLQQAQISRATSEEIGSISGSAHDFERIGDQLRSLLFLVDRKRRKNMVFPREAMDELREMATDVHDIVQLVTRGILTPSSTLLRDAHVLEDRINRSRHQTRKAQVRRMAEQSIDPISGILIIEILTRFEKIGDHAFNIAHDFAPSQQA